MKLKPLKIDKKNEQAITAALVDANGQSREHTFNTYTEIWDLAQQAERQLDELSLTKAARAGAAMEAVSGKPLALSYSWARRATRVVIERRPSAWYLTEIEVVAVWHRGGKSSLQLTQKQDTEAVSILRSGYSMRPTGHDAAPAAVHAE